MHANQHNPTKHQQCIADEYDEPFADVIVGYRRNGHTWKTIAGAIEVPLETLRKWARQLGIQDKIRNNEHVWPRPLDAKAKSLGYAGISDMIVCYRMDGKTRQELADVLGCHKLSLTPYVPDEIKEYPVRTQKQIDARRRNIQIINQRHRGI